ncbi:methyltransferase [Amycolatopsis samaneae]|uniref:Methyltransferase n=1 Tax=Amycolatopsis samaneae TaxID=664691 RepID=A0ABW5GRP4_9PSEU
MTPDEATPVTAGRASAFFLLDEVLGYLYPAALRVAAALGVADHLTEGPRSAAELARATGADPAYLYRTLRLLATRGVFAEDEAGRFALTPAADALRTDAPVSARSAILMLTDKTFWQPAGELPATVREGTTVFERIFGTSFFGHFSGDPATAAIFHDGMAGMADPENPLIAHACAFPDSATVVDVGGGHGGLLLAALRANPGIRGVLFDQPHVLAEHHLGELGADDRWETATGDFFTEVPRGDVYLIKRILHDWDDEESVRILRQCRRAMSAGGRVLVADSVLPTGNDPHPGKTFDLLMMASLSGRERTRAEFERLFTEAGLELTRVIPTGSPLSVVEGTAA